MEKKESIFLVMHHLGGNLGHGFGDDINHGKRGYSCYDHDKFCHCLRVERQTHATRKQANARAEEINKANPEDFAFSLEVGIPK